MRFFLKLLERLVHKRAMRKRARLLYRINNVLAIDRR